MIKQEIHRAFKEKYGTEPLMFKAAGRINLIGEHTDYNDGFVLPAAINKAVFVAIQKRDDNQFSWQAFNLDMEYEGTTDNIYPVESSWPNYILGVIDQLKKKDYKIGGFNLVIGGDVPNGAGLSSSAAVECATIFALNELYNLGIDKIEMVKMAQTAENEFAGVKCGIMDQFASMMGKKGHAIKLDCRTLEYEYIPFTFDDVEIVLFDSKVKHSLASSEYNTRREECEEGVKIIKQTFPAIKNLRDVNIEMVETLLTNTGKIYDRCKFVVEEIARLNEACNDLTHNNLEGFGKKMFATHEGLSKLYEVSCTELDFLAECAKDETGILGARMMGGGFGGCTINLVKKDEAAGIIERISEKYFKKFQTHTEAYRTLIDNGAEIL